MKLPGVKLEIGCGNRPREGYVHMDYEPKSRDIDIIADVHNIPLDDEKCEEIIMVQVLEHIFWGDIFWVLGEINRVMRTGGRFIVEVPDVEKALAKPPGKMYSTYTNIYSDKKFEHTLRFMDRLIEGPMHSCCFTEERLTWFLENTGFKVICRNVDREKASVHAWLDVLCLEAEKVGPPKKTREIETDFFLMMSGYKWVYNYIKRWDRGERVDLKTKCASCGTEGVVVFPRPPHGILVCTSCVDWGKPFEVEEVKK